MNSNSLSMDRIWYGCKEIVWTVFLENIGSRNFGGAGSIQRMGKGTKKKVSLLNSLF